MATKEFVTFTPSTGSGDATISVTASENSGAARSETLSISGSGVSKSVSISQEIGVPFEVGDYVDIQMSQAVYKFKVTAVNKPSGNVQGTINLSFYATEGLRTGDHLFGIVKVNNQLVDSNLLGSTATVTFNLYNNFYFLISFLH